jgi:hypothetical protein
MAYATAAVNYEPKMLTTHTCPAKFDTQQNNTQ